MIMIAVGSLVIASVLVAVGQLVSDMHGVVGRLDPDQSEAR